MVLGIIVIAGASMSVTASINYILEPMESDLNLSTQQSTTALAIPAIASLLVVFVAGMLGDRLGHRKVLFVSSVIFILGCLVIAVSAGVTMLSIGLLLEGVGATVMCVVSLGLLSSQIEDDAQRASAFATFGLVSPIVYLSMPVIAGFIVGITSWRVVPFIWIGVGVLSVLAAMLMLPKIERSANSGEVITPLLAGLVLATAVQVLSHIEDSGLFSIRVLCTLGLGVCSLIALIVCMKRMSAPSLSLAPLRRAVLVLLIIVVLLMPFANTWYFATLLFQDGYGLSPLQAAMVLIPAQVAGMIGAKAVAGPLMRKWGISRAGLFFLVLLSIAMFSSLLIRPTSELWVPTVVMMFFGFTAVGAATVMTNAVMSSSPRDQSGNTSAFKSAASSIGVAMGFLIMGSLVFGATQASLESSLQGSGISQERIEAEVQSIQDSQNADSLTQYAIPPPIEQNLLDQTRGAIVDGFHVDGVIGGAIAVISTVLFLGYARRMHHVTQQE